MTLGRKLFLLIGGLLCLLLAGQWLLYRSLSRRVSEDVRTVAVRVGEEIVSGFEFEYGEGGDDAPLEVRERSPLPPPGEGGHARVFVLRTKTEPGETPAEGTGADAGLPRTESAGPIPAPGASAEPAPKVIVRKELHWQSRAADPPAATGDAATSATGTQTFERRIAPGERPFAIDVGEADDVLLLRGPQMARSIPIPGRMVASTLERFGSQLLAGNLVLLAVGLAAAAWLAHRMSRPLAELAATAERVGEGELGAAVAAGDAARHDEVGRAVASFNRMSTRLAELDRENRRLAEAEQLSELGDVARGLAHSLRNPLNALGLSIERLGARSGGDASAADLVDGSRRQIRRIDGALRSFLALASSGSAQAEPVDLAALARETALEALHDAAAPAPRIEVDSAAGERFVVSGVAAELKAILQALVVNACEAVEREGRSEGGGTVRIRLTPGRRERSDGVTVTIEDDGPGLPASVRERLFTPHTTTKPHGSGMGLFLAHRLATARYGGALRLEPASEGRGTHAILELGDRQGAATSRSDREQVAPSRSGESVSSA